LNPPLRWTLGALLLAASFHSRAQSPSPHAPPEQDLHELAADNHWADLAALLQPVSPRSADQDFYYGIALAHLGRIPGARQALEDGRRLAPGDPRFPVELAGIAFQQKDYSFAARRLRQAVRLAPGDSYTNDFLATTYFLEGNIEAALKYWNRLGKPAIANVRQDPIPRISPALLDRAFAFSPAAALTPRELLDSDVRVGALGIFPQFHFDLSALPDGKFDLLFRAHELDGFGDSKLEALVLFFQGLPFQQVNPQFYDFHRQAINFASLFRWDAQKRRIFAQFSRPFQRRANYRWNLAADLRDENWAIRNGFAGPAPVLAGFNLRDQRLAFTVASYSSARINGSAGAEISHRNFRTVELGSAAADAPSPVLTSQMLAAGYQLVQQAQLAGTLVRLPERRFVLDAQAASNAARLWSQPNQAFEKLTGSLGWRWFPQNIGQDYETSQQFRAGRTFGQVPFDELFILGLERDNDLPLRAHIGTRDGRKGSAPLGRDYFLENWELNKNLYGNGILKLQLGPIFDTGKIADPGTALGSHRWLFDTGAQAKLRLFGAGLVFSYGKDLLTGNNAFYLAPLR